MNKINLWIGNPKFEFPVILLFLLFAFLHSSAGFTNDSTQQYEQRFENALKLKPNVDSGRKLYRYCVACHGPEGWGTINGAYPQIAGQLFTVIIKQLADISSGNRGNPIMRAFTSTRVLASGQDIADLAAYISRLPMTQKNGQGNQLELESGQLIYGKNCKTCHGNHGEGHLEDHIPLIQGQHFNYLMRQFRWIRGGHRQNADIKMIRQIQNFTPHQEYAVMSYVANLIPSQEKLAPPGWNNPDFPNFDRKWSPEKPRDKPLIK